MQHGTVVNDDLVSMCAGAQSPGVDKARGLKERGRGGRGTAGTVPCRADTGRWVELGYLEVAWRSLRQGVALS